MRLASSSRCIRFGTPLPRAPMLTRQPGSCARLVERRLLQQPLRADSRGRTATPARRTCCRATRRSSSWPLRRPGGCVRRRRPARRRCRRRSPASRSSAGSRPRLRVAQLHVDAVHLQQFGVALAELGVGALRPTPVASTTCLGGVGSSASRRPTTAAAPAARGRASNAGIRARRRSGISAEEHVPWARTIPRVQGRCRNGVPGLRSGACLAAPDAERPRGAGDQRMDGTSAEASFLALGSVLGSRIWRSRGEGCVTCASNGCAIVPTVSSTRLHVGARLAVRRHAEVAVDRAFAGVVGRRAPASGRLRSTPAASAGRRCRRGCSAPGRTRSCTLKRAAVSGISCISPWAFFGDTPLLSKFDSASMIASTSSGVHVVLGRELLDHLGDRLRGATIGASAARGRRRGATAASSGLGSLHAVGRHGRRGSPISVSMFGACSNALLGGRGQEKGGASARRACRRRGRWRTSSRGGTATRRRPGAPPGNTAPRRTTRRGSTPSPNS